MLYCERHANVSSGREDEKKKHHKSLAEIVRRFVCEMHRLFAENSPRISEAYHHVLVSVDGLVTITCKELDGSTGKLAGAYIALMKTAGGSHELKSGITGRSRNERASEQEELVEVYDGMSDADLEKIIPERFVDEVARLRCPHLCFSTQKRDEERLEIRRYLAEILNGCLFQSQVHPFGNGSVGEGLWMSMPTAIYDKLNPALTNEGEAVAFMRNVDKLVITPTWITFLGEMYREAQRDSPDLLKLLPTRPNDLWSCSVTHAMYRQLWGDDIICLPGLPEDAINESPRKAYLAPIVDKIGYLLLEIQCQEEYRSDGIIPITMVSELRELLRPLRGEFYDNYMQPTETELAAAMKALLEKNLVNLPSSHAIVMERCGYRAMKKHEPTYWESIFCGAKLIDILKRGTGEPSEDAALLIMTRRGERIIITKSHFKVFSELTTLEVSAGASESFMALAEIRNKAGKMSDGHFICIKETLGTFLGRWMGFGGTLGSPSGSFYRARRLALEEGVIAPPPPAGVLTVSKPLKMHYLVVLYMWHSLGPDFFALLFQACGFGVSLDSENRPVTPLDPSFVCPVCKGHNVHRRASGNRISCALVECDDSAIPPMHCCYDCAKDLYHAESMTWAYALDQGETLTEDQQRRAVRARKREREREKRVQQQQRQQQRQQQCQAQIDAKREQERDWKRKQQQQYQAKIEADKRLILARYQPSRTSDLISRATEITGYKWLQRQVKAHPGQLAKLEERTISGYSWVFIHSLTPPKCPFPKVLFGDRIFKINGEDVSGMNMTQIATKLKRVSNTEWKLDILRPFRVAGASNQQPAVKKRKTCNCDDKEMLLKLFPEAIVAYDNAVQDQSDLREDSLTKSIMSFRDMKRDCFRAVLFVSFEKYVPKSSTSSWTRKKLAAELVKNIMEKFDWRSKERGDLWADYT